jgi:exopolysaccharide biosynthesis protein
MKNKIRLFLLIPFILFIPVNNFSQDLKTLQDGIEYAELTREIDKLPVRMNLLRLDLTKVRIDVVHAFDKAIGVETVSAMAQKHKAFAAINAGFFRLDKTGLAGDAAGVLQINGKLLSESVNNRDALFITNGAKTTVAFAHLFKTAHMETRLPAKTNLSVNFSGLNRERKDDELVLFTPEFGPKTLTSDGGLEIVIGKDDRIAQMLDGKGNNAIPSKGFVISATGTWRQQLLNTLSVGDKIWITYMSSGDESARSPAITGAEDIVAGVPQLIKDGRVDITWEREKSSKSFVETKHPRTAVAKLKDGKFLMITVDGRSESSGGISLNDLAALLLEFGATDAINLDGGGSTTMFLDGKVANHPSDKEGERKVSDALLVFPRKR